MTELTLTNEQLQACLDGDAAAWAGFVDEYARLIHAAVSRAIGPGGVRRSDVEDIAQDVFVKLVRDDFRLLRQFDPAKARLGTFLTVIARTTAIDAVRRRRLSTVSLADDRVRAHAESRQAANSAEDGNDAGAAVQSDGEAISRALSRLEMPADLLSDRQRLVLQCLFDRQMSVEEAAAALGVEAQTIRSTKHKAIARLRSHFQPRAQPPP